MGGGVAEDGVFHLTEQHFHEYGLWADPAAEEAAEGGGEEDVIILFSLRPYSNGLIYEIINENNEVELAVSFDDFKEMKEMFESEEN